MANSAFSVTGSENGGPAVQLAYNCITQTILGSKNVSSVVHSATGTITVNYTNPFSTATYSIAGWGNNASANANIIICGDSADPLVGSSIHFVSAANSGSAVDASYVSLIMFGN